MERGNDLVIKLKAEYRTALNWIIPYPGDWYILKNILPIFIQLYFDADFKQLPTKFHYGSIFRILRLFKILCYSYVVVRSLGSNMETPG